MLGNHHSRRAFLRATACAGVALPVATAAFAQRRPQDPTAPFAYQVERTEAEWRALLSEDEYEILREGGTELPTTSPLWDDYRQGDFSCRGCDLQLYTSDWRAEIDKGWVFFHHSLLNAVLTSIDAGGAYTMGMVEDPKRTLIEVHCRRCGSHLGHILVVDAQLVHCINGTSLVFHPASA